MKQNVLMIVNPVAGKAKINRKVNKIRDIVSNLRDIEIDIKYTAPKKSATDIIMQYDKNFDILFVCGGDGTLNQSINGLCNSIYNAKVAYLPIGTTNDFAKSLGVPFKIKQQSKKIDSTEIKTVDVGKFNNCFFNYVASTGLFAKTSYQTTSKMKNKYGRLAYVISGIKEVFTCKPQKLKVKINDELVEDEFIYTSISNSSYIGGFKLFRKQDAKLDDGKFEVLLVKNNGRLLNILKLLIKIITGNFKDKNIIFYKTDKLCIESENEIEWSIDGEYGGKTNKVDISNLNKQIKYIMYK